MAGESGGEFGGSILGAVILNGVPNMSTLGVSTGTVSSDSSSALLVFIATAQASSIDGSAADAIQAFIAQATTGGVSGSEVQALLAFLAQVDAGTVNGSDLDAWQQITHLQDDLAALLLYIGQEDRVIRIADEYRVIKILGGEMSIPIYTKQPGDNIDIDIDLSAVFSGSDTVFTAVAVAEAGITLGVTSMNTVTKFVKQWVSGGTTGNRYKVTMTITSTEGRVKEVDFYVKVKEL